MNTSSSTSVPAKPLTLSDVAGTILGLVGATCVVGFIGLMGDNLVARWRLDANFFGSSSPMIQTMDGWDSIKSENPRVIEGAFTYYVAIDNGDMFFANAMTDDKVRNILATLAKEQGTDILF